MYVAGYFHNPELHYAPNFKVDLEVKNGLISGIRKDGEWSERTNTIYLQLEDFKLQKNLFGNPMAIRAIGKKTLGT